MKTLEDERYVVIKAYKCTVSEIWRDFFCISIRGATALLVAVATLAATRRSESQVSQLFPINAHATWQPRSVDR